MWCCLLFAYSSITTIIVHACVCACMYDGDLFSQPGQILSRQSRLIFVRPSVPFACLISRSFLWEEWPKNLPWVTWNSRNTNELCKIKHPIYIESDANATYVISGLSIISGLILLSSSMLHCPSKETTGTLWTERVLWGYHCPLHRVEYTNSLCLMHCRLTLCKTDLWQMKGVIGNMVAFNHLIHRF